MNEESKDKAVPLQQLQTAQVSRQQLAQRENAAMSPFASISNFENAQRMARILCGSNLVPDTYRGAEAIGDCVIALGMANRMGCDPVMVMQNLYVVHGRPAWSGQFVIAAINQSGRFAEPLHFEQVGTPGQDDYGFYAETTANNTGKVIKGPTITIRLAKAEGWYNKNPKWKNMPEMMLRYRAGSWFGRTECPEILMGFQSREEVVDAIEFDPTTGEVMGEDTFAQPKTIKAEVLKDAPPETVVVGGSADTPEPVQDKVVEGEPDSKPDPATDEPEQASSQQEQLDAQGWYEDSNRKFNVHGEIWTENAHATGRDGNPIINSDGHYRMRRGGALPGTEVETAKPDVVADANSQEPPTPGYEKEPEFVDGPDNSNDWMEGLE